MSLKYRDSQGNETPIAGLNGTSGELVPSVAAVRKGTFTVPPKPEAAISTDVVITFSTPMEDENYEVVFSTEPYWPEIILLAGDKTVNGFEAHIAYPINVPISYTINYTAFKLMTDEVHEADSTHIAQNTANFAPAFSEVTSYAVGDYVTYNNILYRCTTAHTAGTWVAGHFTQVTVGGTLGAIVPSDASASNKLVAKDNLTNLTLDNYQLQVGGDNYAWFDLGTSTSTTNSQAFLFYEITYGRIDGGQSKILVSCSGTMVDANYIKIVNLNNTQTSALERFKLDSNKHLWLGMQSYCYARVKVCGRWAGMGSKTTVEPTGMTLPIQNLVAESELPKTNMFKVTGDYVPGVFAITTDSTDGFIEFEQTVHNDTSIWPEGYAYIKGIWDIARSTIQIVEQTGNSNITAEMRTYESKACAAISAALYVNANGYKLTKAMGYGGAKVNSIIAL